MATGRYTVVSLFSGAGGLDAGFQEGGPFQLLACVELEPQFCATLRLNRDSGLLGSVSTQVVQADVSTLDPFDLMDRLGLAPGELDVLIGGPPCQSFSTAGRRRTVSDPRGTLIWDFARFVEALQPKIFVMENVRGLLSAAIRHRPIRERPERGGPPLSDEEVPGSVIRLWAEDVHKIGGGAYRIDCFEVNAVNYGAPQLRERVLFFGNRLGKVIDFPQPTHGPGERPWRTLRDAIGDFRDDNPLIMDFSPRKKAFLSLVPPGGNWRALPETVARESMGAAFHAKGGRSGWWRRLSWDLPSPTIVTLPNHASTSMCHPDEIRALSVGECARIQEFPRGWRFTGTVREQMTQVGNAVPTRLGLVAGQVVAHHLAHRDAGTADPGAPHFRKVYLRSHVRTRQWYKAGRVYVRGGAEA